jgi:hypothetical protein
VNNTESTVNDIHPEQVQREVNAMSTPTLITTRTDFATAGSAAFKDNAAKTRRTRLHWRWLRRRPGLWIAPCRDEAGRRGQLLVALIDDDRVALVVPRGGVAVLDLLTVGRLRAALRHAVLTVADPDTERPSTYAVPTTRRSA